MLIYGKMSAGTNGIRSSHAKKHVPTFDRLAASVLLKP
jgi:hypothetical protein